MMREIVQQLAIRGCP